MCPLHGLLPCHYGEGAIPMNHRAIYVILIESCTPDWIILCEQLQVYGEGVDKASTTQQPFACWDIS